MENNKSINSLEKGLNLDVPLYSQPKGTYRYALNMSDETAIGDMNFLSNEESDFYFTSLTRNFIPLGKVYIGNKRFVIWSVSKDEQVSEIGILDIKLQKYEDIVNDKESLPEFKLGFSLSHQIQAVYRLRGGCDLTVYWVDKKSPIRYFNFNKKTDFQNSNGMWIAEKFNLQKTYKTIPEFTKVDVLESGGNLEPGSYNFSIQYVDEDLNPTEWITSSPIVKIYNDLVTKDYADIHGSINSESDYIRFPATNKSIQIKFSNLDTNYIYYRVAIICANNGSGNINKVYYSDVITTSKNTFIYTGVNHATEGTTQEISAFTNILGKAGHIEQLENRLIVADIEGMQNNYCVLQKYASQIKVDCVTKNVLLNSMTDENTKNPTYDFNGGAGYMPGEIYARGVVWIFTGNQLSPVFHIPGKPQKDKDKTYTQGNNIYPMSINNVCKNTFYTDNDTDYWGIDYTGTPLMGKNVRHHRFPLRSELGIPLIKSTLGAEYENKYYALRLNIKGNLRLPIPCPEDNPKCRTDSVPSFSVKIEYKVDGESFFFTETVDPAYYADNVNTEFPLDTYSDSRFHGSPNINSVKLFVSNINGIYQEIKNTDFTPYFNGTPSFTTSVVNTSSTLQDKAVVSEIMGLRYSNIRKPSIEETNGLEVIGYYIVGAERTEFDKTILDSAVMFPTVVNNKYISHGLLQPETDKISRNVYAVLHPEHKFNQKEYVVFDKIIQEGNYKVTTKKYGKINYDDVYDGSSYNKKNHKEGNDDGHDTDGDPTSRGYDGWSFNLITRDNIVDFEAKKDFVLNKEDIKENFYLDALDYKPLNDYKDDFYNIACDNKIGVIQTKTDNHIKGNMPYVVYYKENIDPYSNFRNIPYYKESINPVYFGDEIESTTNVFNGDSFVTSMRYNNSIYWDNRVADRRGKKSILKIILGVVVAIAGAVLAFFTGGAGAIVVGAGIALMGAGALFVSSGLKIANFNRAYSEEYEKGLRQTALDNWTDMFYNYKSNIPFGFFGNGKTGSSGPSDDTIQWANDCVTDLWFESSLNMNLRNGFYTDDVPTFMSSPWRVESGNNTPIGTWEFFGAYYTDSNSQRYPISTLEKFAARKLLAFDEARDDNRFYLGAALGEYYSINPDYKRINKEKAFFHLPIEYACCAECTEVFPHRWYWSEQSFQEELTDNYRVFLPNNYRDITGETGTITNIFTFGSNFYIHTEEALWQVPRNQQERITDQIVSFIGTGEYFSIPPRAVIDGENGLSAGCQHKNSTLKTPGGVYFISENQKSVFRFDGKQVHNISALGLSNWFSQNLEIKNDLEYYRQVEEEYPFKDNPSNPYGTGFTLGYDTKKERILITKTDNIINSFERDSKLSMNQGKLVIYRNIQSILEEKDNEGWKYETEEKGQLKFSKIIYENTSYTTYKNGVATEETGIVLKTIYSYINGKVLDNISTLKNSFTISFSLKYNAWRSWHSYYPKFYLYTSDELISNDGDSNLYKHNKQGSVGIFRGKTYSSDIEYVIVENPLETTLIDELSIHSETYRYYPEEEFYAEENNITFNNIIVYNSRQCSGNLKLVVKEDSSDYMWNQVQNLDVNEIFIDKNEKTWYINNLRDIVKDYSKPLFLSNIKSKQKNYYTDKVLNESVLDYNKDWTQLESFRDKFLAVRLSFNNFEQVKLTFNYSVADEKKSYR